MRFVSLTLSALVAISAASSAQTPESGWPPMVGIKARVIAPSFGVEKRPGVIESVRGDTVQFRAAAGVTSLAPSDITRLEVLSGTHRETGKWTAIGFVAGALGGAAIGALSYKHKGAYCQDFICIPRDNSKSADAAAGALLGLVGGSVIGAVYGHRLRETWTEFPLPAR
jgi:hypothetical protein